MRTAHKEGRDPLVLLDLFVNLERSEFLPASRLTSRMLIHLGF